MTFPGRLLLVTRNFPPLTGGMERLNFQAFLALRQSYSVAVCGPSGAGKFLDEQVVRSEVPLTPLSRFLLACQWKSLTLALEQRPQVVYSGSGLTAPSALTAGRIVGARTVCFLHGLDIVVDHPLYRRLFLPAIRRMDRVLVNSRHTEGLAVAADVQRDRIVIVNPGVELPDWQARDVARQRFRACHGVGQRPLLLAAGRLTQRKGMAEFIRNSLPEICRQLPDVLLLIIGSEAKNALKHQSGVEAGIRAAIQEAGLIANVRLLGSVDDQCLSDAYFSADVLVFPVLDLPGDVEGFGMVAVEAAAHGLPTVAFAVGGVPDAVADGLSGCLIPSGDYAGMTQKTLGLLQEGDHAWRHESCRKHAEQFSWIHFGERLTAALSWVS